MAGLVASELMVVCEGEEEYDECERARLRRVCWRQFWHVATERARVRSSHLPPTHAIAQYIWQWRSYTDALPFVVMSSSQESPPSNNEEASPEKALADWYVYVFCDDLHSLRSSSRLIFMHPLLQFTRSISLLFRRNRFGNCLCSFHQTEKCHATLYGRLGGKCGRFSLWLYREMCHSSRGRESSTRTRTITTITRIVANGNGSLFSQYKEILLWPYYL